MENLTTTYLNTPNKGLLTDLDASLVSKEFWTYARNATINSHQGNLQFLQNEPSNRKCVDLPYSCIGFVKIKDARYVMFLTDNIHSEIGIFDSKNCTYVKLVNSPCLNFNTSYLIDAASKENFDCSETVYWTDNLNPRRKLNLSKIPYIFTLANDACETKEFTKDLDCNELLLTPKLTVPDITVTLGSGGALRNGSYQVAMAYTINKQRVSDYYSVTNPQPVWSHINLGQSIDVSIANLDREFDQYVLVVIYTIDQTTTAKIIGYFSTSDTHHQIVSVDRDQYITITFEELLTLRPKYYLAEHVAHNDQFLLWSGVTTRPELNYQTQAMSIRSKWVLHQVPKTYYANGGNKVGYCRGERYAFGIQWLYETGEWSSAFHIPGRKADSTDLSQATGSDVYEKFDPACGIDGKIRHFEVYDTSKTGVALNRNSTCSETDILEGEMAYWESTELYPDNKIMFSNDACTPIRHSQFPGECHAPRYIKGGDSVNILGAKFENIEHPKDDKGNYIDGIVGYRIVRSSREGYRSVIAKGMFSNVRSYKEDLNQHGTNEKVLYPNYPYNDLRPDSFISSKQTYYKSGERNNIPLIDYSKSEFNFLSPHTLFSRISLGEEVIFETEEIGKVKGSFENVYNHPKAKLLANSVFWLAVTIGAIDGVLSVFGRRCVTQLKNGVVNITTVTPPSNTTITAAGMQFVQECEGIVNGLTFSQILQLPAIEAVAKAALKILQTAAKAGMAVYFAFNTANNLIADILAFMPYRYYALQYDSHGDFTDYKCNSVDNRRRQLTYYQYLDNGINSVQGVKFNNFKREGSVYVKLNNDILNPTTLDNTRKTIGENGLCDTPYNTFNTTASMWYGMIKRKIADQYGQVNSITYLDTGFVDKTLQNQAAVGSKDRLYSTDTVFGGDMFISKFAVKRSHQFFRQNIANSNSPDSIEYDYSLYRNVGFPRYWLNSERYDLSEVIVVNQLANRLPANKYNLDCFKQKGGVTFLDLKSVPGYFYLFNNGVIDFFVESEYNLDYRDYKGQIQNFYSQSQTSLTDLFRSDRIDTAEEFVYDKSFSKQLIENTINQQRIDYDPTIDRTCFSVYKNRVVYSLPASLDQKQDNWLVYLTNNFYDFSLSELGIITGMFPIDNQQIMFTFDKSAPYVTIGRDELQTVGNIKVTIGDAGLFAREPRPLAYTDYYYGNSQSRWAFVNTQFGSLFPSQRQGRIFNWKGQFEEISRNGMHWWFKNYLPSKLLTDFPDFFDADNPLIGEGLISGWDNTDERYYLSKKDYKLKDEFKTFVIYNLSKKRFELTDGNGGFLNTVSITDPFYFDDSSWTISYSPKDQSFVSWHDWHPDWIVQGERHFFTIKYNSIWSHNERFDSYCNFYNIDYPFEIEYLVNNGGQVEILKNIEYIFEAGKYYSDGAYFHQILDDNFDTLVVHNLEQTSGYLGLNLRPRNKMGELLDLPKLTVDGWEVAYTKTEQKTRVNQFWDITKDRGEYTKNNYPLWTYSPNGYVRTVTDQAINVNKNPFERKKFRNLWHKVFLSKSVSNDRKYIFKFSNLPETISPD